MACRFMKRSSSSGHCRAFLAACRKSATVPWWWSTTRIRPMRSKKCCRRSVLWPKRAAGGLPRCSVRAAIAARLADHVIVTSDNPRSEDPLAIIAAVSAGISATHETEPDRARAIEKAVREAAPADVVLIAGKGHESYQEIAGKRLPFSDAAVAGAALARRGTG